MKNRWARLLGIAAVTTLLTYLALILFAIWINTHPARQPIAAIPRTFNLAAENVALHTSDGILLQGWYAPGLAPGVPGIVVAHGLGANRSDVLPIAVWLHAAGFAVLSVDFRGHGESGDGAVSFGYREARDVRAAVDELARRAPDAPVGLWGTSMGAVAALTEAAADTRVAAVVADSVFPDLETSLTHHLELMYGRWSWLARPLVWAWELRFWRRARDVSPRRAVAARPFPVLLIAGELDSRMPVAGAREVLDAATGPKELWVVPGAGHSQSSSIAGGTYHDRLVTFFNRHLLGPEES